MENKESDTTMLSITEMNTSQLVALPHSEVFAKVLSGEWGIEQFSQWAEDKLNHAYGDGYDEGYTTAEELIEIRQRAYKYCQ